MFLSKRGDGRREVITLEKGTPLILDSFREVDLVSTDGRYDRESDTWQGRFGGRSGGRDDPPDQPQGGGPLTTSVRIPRFRAGQRHCVKDRHAFQFYNCMILLLSKEYEPHCDLVVRELQSRNEEYIRLNAEDVFDRVQVHAGSRSNDALVVSGRKVPVSDVRLVYRRGFGTDHLKPYSDGELNRFFRTEAEASIYGLLYGNNIHWFNHPLWIEIAAHKINQLKKALELGFTVPRTLISNDPAQIRNFVDSNKETVHKVLNLSRLYDSGDKAALSFTRKMRPEDFANAARMAILPSIYQEYIEKKSEIRVTVIGETIIAVEICTQDTEETVDWRIQGAVETPHRIHELPDAVKQKCIALVKVFICLTAPSI